MAIGYVCMIWRKLWGADTRSQHNFALFHRILRSQSSSRPSRPSQARIVGESSKVHIDQPAFVIHREGIPSDHCVWRGRRNSVPEPVTSTQSGAMKLAKAWNRCQSRWLEGSSNGCSNEQD